MRRYIYSIAVILVSLCASAQSQHGYVKTKGRLAKNGTVIAGKRISGAAVQVKGRTAVLSKDNGEFSFPIPSQNFHLQNVSKQGYVLTDPDVLTRMYEYSGNDMIIVMETPEEQAQEQIDAGIRIRTTLTNQLLAKEQELIRLKEEKKISDKKYLELRQELMASQQGNENLINEMVEEYSKIDYDQLDEFSRKVSECILNGKLVKADSLLKSKGSIEDRINRLYQHQDANRKEQEELNKRLVNLEISEYHATKEKEDIAQDCYFFYTKCRMLQQNDSAGYYLEKRASLDTLNFDYVWRCGTYYLNLRKYDKARHYLEILARNKSLAPVDMGMALNDLSICYTYLGLDSLGRATIYESLAIREELAKSEPEKYTVSVALASSNYAAQHALYQRGDTGTAYKYFKVGMELYEQLICHTHFFAVNLANVEENYAQLLMRDSLYTDAEKHMLHSYSIRSEYAERYPEYYNGYKDISLAEIGKLIGQVDCDSFIATRECKMIIISAAQNNKEQLGYTANVLANIYFQKGDYDNCRKYLNESTGHVEELFETNREKFLPDLNYTYLENAYFYLNYLNDREKARSLADKLLLILKDNYTYQELFSNEVAICDVWLLKGRINLMEEDYTGAIRSFSQALEILEDPDIITPENLKNRMIDLHRYMSVAYMQLQDIDNATKSTEYAVELLESLPTDNMSIPVLCSTYFDLAILYMDSSNFTSTCDILGKAVALMENNELLFTDMHKIQIYYYYGVALIYENRYADGLMALKKAQSYFDNVSHNEQISDIINMTNDIVTNLETAIRQQNGI